MLKKIYFLAHVLLLAQKCTCSLLEPPPEVICSLLCKDDFVTDVDTVLSDETLGLDFQKLVENWKVYFEGISDDKQRYFCWHYVDFDHCLRHCAADPKIFVPVKLEPLEVHCEPYMTGLPRYHQSIESNCGAYANAIKMAVEKWTKEENLCKLLSQHLDCLAINTEFYCGSQVAEKNFFVKRFHSLISRGNDYLSVKKLLIDCYNCSVVESKKKKLSSLNEKLPNSTLPSVSSHLSAARSRNRNAYHTVSQDSFARSAAILFGQFENKTIEGPYTSVAVETETPEYHRSSVVSLSMRIEPILSLTFLLYLALILF